ncbi:MAG: hypothetical protein V3V41_07895 [Candidatus Heimdallarchaeota archaeon]
MCDRWEDNKPVVFEPLTRKPTILELIMKDILATYYNIPVSKLTGNEVGLRTG